MRNQSNMYKQKNQYESKGQISENQQISMMKLIQGNERLNEMKQYSNREIPYLQTKYQKFHQKGNQQSNQKILVELQEKKQTQIPTRQMLVRSNSQKKSINKLQFNSEASKFVPNENFQQGLFQRKQTYIKSYTMKSRKKQNDQMSSTTIKQKIPLAILDFISKNAKIKKAEEYASKFKSKAGQRIGKWGLSKRLNQKYSKKRCQICQQQLYSKQFEKISKKCQHQYCSSCLHQYVIFKIKSFQPVLCPKEQCNQTLDTQSKLYIELPLQVRKNYKKIIQYQNIKGKQNRKLCPQQNCEGWIEINEQIDPVCNTCNKKYCPKCLLQAHEDQCDNKQLQFFQGTLHYRQCSKCKNVIEKSTGCIHMTCRCGYQFCYLCGAKWKQSHTCANPNDEVIPRQQINCLCCQFDCQQCLQNCDDRCQDGCCNCCEEQNCCGCCPQNCLCSRQCCDDCSQSCQNCCCNCVCFQNHQCEWLACICTIILKILFILLWLTIIFPFLGILVIFITIFGILVSIITGITVYTVQIISQLDTVWFCLAIFFYPFTMFGGIFLAFRELFCQGYYLNITQMLSDAWTTFTDTLCNQY